MAICELLGDIFELFRCLESSYKPSQATILTENVARESVQHSEQGNRFGLPG